jgi:hypothetical protein
LDKLLKSAVGEIRLDLPQDATTVSVTIEDSAGVTLTSGAASPVGMDNTLWKFALTPTQLAIMDRYVATWTATIGGVDDTYTTQFEVIGAHLFTIEQARAADNGILNSPTDYPDPVIIAARDEITDEFEAECGVSFIPRGERETIDGDGTVELRVDKLLRPSYGAGAGRLVSATIDGTALDGTNLADIAVRRRKFIRKTLGRWSAGTDNIIVLYEHGYTDSPAAVRRAALKLLRYRLVPSNIDDLAVSFTDELGQRQFLPVAGRKKQPFGIPQVDAIVNRYSETSGVGVH